MTKTVEVIEVYKDGRITIPKETLKEFHLRPGDMVVISKAINGITLIPVKLYKKGNRR